MTRRHLVCIHVKEDECVLKDRSRLQNRRANGKSGASLSRLLPQKRFMHEINQ